MDRIQDFYQQYFSLFPAFFFQTSFLFHFLIILLDFFIFCYINILCYEGFMVLGTFKEMCIVVTCPATDQKTLLVTLYSQKNAQTPGCGLQIPFYLSLVQHFQHLLSHTLKFQPVKEAPGELPTLRFSGFFCRDWDSLHLGRGPGSYLLISGLR